MTRGEEFRVIKYIIAFFGSIMYRSSQFAIAEMFYTKFEGNQFMMTQIPGSGGI